MSWESEIKAVRKRLECSDTPLKRKRARKALRVMIYIIEREAEAEFPYLNDDGEERVKYKPSIPCCPFCGIPSRSWASLVYHMSSRHANGMKGEHCWCGKYVSNMRGMSRHLRGVCNLRKVELKDHIAAGVLKKSAGVIP